MKSLLKYLVICVVLFFILTKIIGDYWYTSKSFLRNPDNNLFYSFLNENEKQFIDSVKKEGVFDIEIVKPKIGYEHALGYNIYEVYLETNERINLDSIKDVSKKMAKTLCENVISKRYLEDINSIYIQISIHHLEKTKSIHFEFYKDSLLNKHR
ncbi:MAG: hypothetical protein RL264_434 [Bacteroidota bacterium]|jgi:hypothetical protein